jgi:hypothetical protein
VARDEGTFLMSPLEWCQWLENTSFAIALKESTYMFPVVEGSHLLGMSVSVGLILLLDLRLLGLAFKSEPVSRIMRQVTPWMLAGFGLVFATGLALFAANATAAYTNWFFRFKLLFVAAAGANAYYYQLVYFPKMAVWDTSSVPLGPRVVAATSLLCWGLVIALGRTMAYEL